jgi:hypothetical protein
MIEATPEETIAAVHALRAAGSTEMAFSVSARDKAAMTHKMNKARDIENMKDDPVWFKQHREDTKYVQWQDGMYVMLDDLADPLDLQGYVLAVVEDSLRRSVYPAFDCFKTPYNEDCIGVYDNYAAYWHGRGIDQTNITRAQALYIATGDVNI